jgi:hypothetical protein
MSVIVRVALALVALQLVLQAGCASPLVVSDQKTLLSGLKATQVTEILLARDVDVAAWADLPIFNVSRWFYSFTRRPPPRLHGGSLTITIGSKGAPTSSHLALALQERDHPRGGQLPCAKFEVRRASFPLSARRPHPLPGQSPQLSCPRSSPAQPTLGTPQCTCCAWRRGGGGERGGTCAREVMFLVLGGGWRAQGGAAL